MSTETRLVVLSNYVRTSSLMTAELAHTHRMLWRTSTRALVKKSSLIVIELECSTSPSRATNFVRDITVSTENAGEWKFVPLSLDKPRCLLSCIHPHICMHDSCAYKCHLCIYGPTSFPLSLPESVVPLAVSSVSREEADTPLFCRPIAEGACPLHQA